MSNIESVKNEAQERYPAVVRASDGHLSIIHRDSEEVFIAGRTASNEQTAEALSMNENRIPNRMNPHEVLGEE